MGRASRRKKQRDRVATEDRQWDAAAAARSALRDRTATTLLLEDNPYAAARFADVTDETFEHALWQHIHAGLPLGEAWHETAAWMMGEAGYPGPWEQTTQLIADYAVWEREQQLTLLRQAEICVISPPAHAAVMAAAMTLDAADLLTLDRDTDVPLQAAVVVFPEPVILRTRNAGVGDFSALGWTFSTMYGSTGEEYPSVGVSAMLRIDGPAKTPAGEEFRASAEADGHPLPPWLPAGTNGMRADASSRSASSQASALLTAHARHLLHDAVGDLTTRTRRSPAPDTAQWNGESVEDPYNDFAERYLFAFWRLAAQGITAITGQAPPNADRAEQESAGRRQDSPGIRLIDLRASSAPAPQVGETTDRRYSHRWPVRMHKVNQWYPSLGRHQIRWRGPFIKGPADAPLRTTDRAYQLSV